MQDTDTKMHIRLFAPNKRNCFRQLVNLRVRVLRVVPVRVDPEKYLNMGTWSKRLEDFIGRVKANTERIEL